jgi:hypothetical protein
MIKKRSTVVIAVILVDLPCLVRDGWRPVKISLCHGIGYCEQLLYHLRDMRFGVVISVCVAYLR